MPAAEQPTTATAGTPASRRCACLFGRDSRILSRARFEELYAGRAKRAGRYVVAYWDAAPAGVAVHRLGATAAKRTFHDAHERNRAKRLLRESFRLLRPDFRGGPWDLVLVARRPILHAKEPEVRADVASLCRAAGILGGSQVPGSQVPGSACDLRPATCDAKPEVSP